MTAGRGHHWLNSLFLLFHKCWLKPNKSPADNNAVYIMSHIKFYFVYRSVDQQHWKKTFSLNSRSDSQAFESKEVYMVWWAELKLPTCGRGVSVIEEWTAEMSFETRVLFAQLLVFVQKVSESMAAALKCHKINTFF